MATRKTLSFTGMDAADAAELESMFTRAASGRGWSIAPESSAEVLVIDVDSIYGHMTWLRMHNSERTIVALSEAVSSSGRKRSANRRTLSGRPGPGRGAPSCHRSGAGRRRRPGSGTHAPGS